MITITNPFIDKTETRNPVKLLGVTDAFLSAAGTAGSIIVNCPSQPVAGNYFYIYVAGIAIKFTGVASSPNYANNEFTVPNLAFSTDWDLFVSEIMRNYYISKYFTYVSTFFSSTLTLTEKVPGAASIINTVTVSSHFALTITPGVAATYAAGYKTSLQIHRQTDVTADAEDNLVAVVETVPEADQTFAIECSHALAALVSANPPSTEDISIEPCADMVAWFNAVLTEQYGAPLLIRGFTTQGSADDYPQAFYGGTRRRLFMLDAWDYEDNYLNATLNRFLSYAPDRLCVLTSQLIPLYFYVQPAHTTINLHYNITYTDGTTATGNAETRVIGTHLGGIYRLQAGYDKLDLGALNPGKTAA